MNSNTDDFWKQYALDDARARKAADRRYGLPQWKINIVADERARREVARRYGLPHDSSWGKINSVADERARRAAARRFALPHDSSWWKINSVADSKTHCTVCAAKKKSPLRELLKKAIKYGIKIPPGLYGKAVRENRTCYCDTRYSWYETTASAYNALCNLIREGVSKKLTRMREVKAAEAIVTKILDETQLTKRVSEDKLGPHRKYLMEVLMEELKIQPSNPGVKDIKPGHLARMNRVVREYLKK